METNTVDQILATGHLLKEQAASNKTEQQITETGASTTQSQLMEIKSTVKNMPQPKKNAQIFQGEQHAHAQENRLQLQTNQEKSVQALTSLLPRTR